jgi:hypothetical protein
MFLERLYLSHHFTSKQVNKCSTLSTLEGCVTTFNEAFVIGYDRKMDGFI